MRKLAALVFLTWTASVFGDVQRKQYSWFRLAQEKKVAEGQVLGPDATNPFEQMKVENKDSGGKTVLLLTLPGSELKRAGCFLSGRIRSEKSESGGRVEVWDYTAGGRKYVIPGRLEQGGRLELKGDRDWQTFLIRFSTVNDPAMRTEKVEVRLVVDGRGTIYLTPLELGQYIPAVTTRPAATGMNSGLILVLVLVGLFSGMGAAWLWKSKKAQGAAVSEPEEESEPEEAAEPVSEEEDDGPKRKKKESDDEWLENLNLQHKIRKDDDEE